MHKEAKVGNDSSGSRISHKGRRGWIMSNQCFPNYLPLGNSLFYLNPHKICAELFVDTINIMRAERATNIHTYCIVTPKS